MVYVISRDGHPLMPTARHGKVKRLLKEGKAKVIRRSPFTIQLLYDSTTYVQPVSLGIDAGSRYIGISATTEKTVLFESEVELRNDIVGLLSDRRKLRRERRGRKTRHRERRFRNRVKSKHKGWLAPSVENKIEAHLKVVANVHRLLPVSEVVAETASFDIQKIKNPYITADGYRNGEQKNFYNVREYVLFRDGHVCQHCKGKTGDLVLNVHHIESRRTGGDSPNNLITLCATCHGRYHRGEIALAAVRGRSFKAETFMGIMRWAFFDKLKQLYANVRMTYGYITKSVRIAHGLPKEHRVDARCISGNPAANPPAEWFFQKQVRTRNRRLHERKIQKGGTRQGVQSPKYVFGFQLFDKVLVNGSVEAFIFGRRTKGYFQVRTLDGALKKDITYKKLKRLETRKPFLVERRPALAE